MQKALLTIGLVAALAGSVMGHGFNLSAVSTPQGLQLVAVNNGEATGYDRLFAEYFFDSGPDDYVAIHGGVIRSGGFSGTVSLNVEFLSPLWFSDGNPAEIVSGGEKIVGNSFNGAALLGSVTIDGQSATPSSFPITGLSDHSLGWSLQPYPVQAGTYGFAFRVSGSQQNGAGTQIFLPSLPVVVALSTPGFFGSGSFGVQDSLDELYEALIGNPNPPLSPNQWKGPGGGAYHTVANWVDSPAAGVIPNATDAVARFLGTISADSTVSVDAPVSVGSIQFNNAHRYSLSGAAPITLSSSTTAEIRLTSGNHTIATPLAIASSTNIVAGGQTLTLQGAPSWSAGKTLTVASGTLAYSTSSAASAVGAGAKLVIASGSTVNVGGTADPFSAGSIPVAVQNESATGLNITSGTKAVGAITGLGQTTLAQDATLAADSIRQSAVVLHGAVDHAAGRLTIRSGAAASLSVVNSLQIDSAAAPIDSNPATPLNSYYARLDLTRNKLVVDYSGASPAATIRDALQAGYGTNKNWTGTGGITTSLGNNNSFALGYAEASSLFTSFPATFAGQQVDNTSVLVSYTRYGDANLSGTADFSDLSLLLLNYNQPGGWNKGDFDYNGTVNFSDLSQLLLNYNQATPLTASLQPVPEPSACLLAALACATMLAGSIYRLRPRQN